MLERFRAQLGRRVAPPRYLVFALILVIGSATAFRATGTWNTSLLLGFDLASWVFLALVRPLLDDDVATMRRTAQANDANRVALLAITVLISALILIAIGTLIADKPTLKTQGLVLVVVTLASIWLFANTVFALHYAHLYYLPGGDTDVDADTHADTHADTRADLGGLVFPQDGAPDYWDFLYFSFTLGMTFQTSDIAIRARHMRKVVLGHTMAAFAFNVGVLAFTVNALGGM